MHKPYGDEEFHVCKKEDKSIKKDVSLVAMIKVKPIIRIVEKEIEAKCVGCVHLSECKKHHIKEVCEFCIKQDLTLRIPVHFDVETDVKDKGIICHSKEHCHDYDFEDDCDDEK